MDVVPGYMGHDALGSVGVMVGLGVLEEFPNPNKSMVQSPRRELESTATATPLG